MAEATALSILDQLGQKVLDAAFKLYLLDKNPLIKQARRVAEIDDPDHPEVVEFMKSDRVGESVRLVLEHMSQEASLNQAMKEYCSSREIYNLTVGEGVWP